MSMYENDEMLADSSAHKINMRRVVTGGGASDLKAQYEVYACSANGKIGLRAPHASGYQPPTCELNERS